MEIAFFTVEQSFDHMTRKSKKVITTENIAFVTKNVTFSQKR